MNNRCQLLSTDEKIKQCKSNISNYGKGWDFLKEYINGFKIGSCFTRKDVLSHFLNYSPRIATYTIDNYRNLLCQIGILEYIERGKYRVLKKIPEQMTTTILQKIYYERDTWKAWFMTIEDRVKIYK